MAKEAMVECSACTLWERHVCTDDNGNPVTRSAVLAEPVWYYETCKKNWGLPQTARFNAESNGSKCKFFVRKKP